MVVGLGMPHPPTPEAQEVNYLLSLTFSSLECGVAEMGYVSDISRMMQRLSARD